MEEIERYFRGHLNFRHMRLLVALDDYRNVNRVAAYLNVTQPAVSKTLTGLESGLGLQLFHRTNRGMEPTRLGSTLIRHARMLLAQLHEAQSELREINENRISRISMGVLPTAALVVIPQFIARIESNASSSTIRIIESTMDRLLQMLRAGDVEFVFGLLPHAPMPAEFGSALLMDDPILPAVRRGHPLTRLTRMDWEDLARFQMILPTPTATTRFPIESILSAHNITINARRVETVSTMTIIGTMQYTDSIGFLSASVARHFRDLGEISILPVILPNVTLRMGLIWLSDKRDTDAHKLVLDVFREVCDRINAKSIDLDLDAIVPD